MKLKIEENFLQQELDKLYTPLINSKKCFIMLFSRAKTFAFAPDFTVGNTDIQEVKQTL